MQLYVPTSVLNNLRGVWLYVLVPGLVAVLTVTLLTFTVLPVALVVGTACFALAAYFGWSIPTKQTSLHMTPDAEQLVATKAQLEHLFAHSPVPYLRVDRSGDVLQGNLAAVRLFATTQTGVTNLNIFAQIVTDEAGTDAVIRGKLESGVSISDLELLITTAKEEQRWVRLSLYVAGIDATECLVTLVDITQQKRVDLAKSEFVALAAHQLRTPIAAIRWNMELFSNAQPTDLDPKLRAYIEKVSRNAVRMIRLINDFLSVSKLETGTFEADPETVDFSAYLDEILDEFAVPIQQKQLEIRLNTPPQPVTVTADGRLLHILTSNLISNATKYTPAQGQIQIAYETRGNTIVFSVTDTGIGIPEREQPQLFTKFYRATNARQHRSEGTGLGLYIVKQSVEILGGTITMRSQENQGSTFTVTFPIQPATTTTTASARTP